MKRFKNFDGVSVLAILLPILLIVPNIALCVTEHYSFWAALTNIILPWSIYSLIMSLWRRTGIMTYLMLPFMVYASFQIVLLYLYGGSIIAVDMFLNVVTTNATEVGELLGNLILAIAIVVGLYVPPLIAAAVFIIKKRNISPIFMFSYRKISSIAIVVSCLVLVATYLFVPKYSLLRELFPVNVIGNMCRAIKRTNEISHYMETSKDFRYNAVSTHPADDKEIYLLVIGETSRGENWQLLGYERENNPKLNKIDSLIVFNKAVTQSNTTHKSVPMIMSSLTAENFDSINYHKSIITAFKEAGFHTYLFSNQTRNRSYTEHFCNEADEQEYIKDRLGSEAQDHELLDNLDKALADTLFNKKFIILHTYGSHFNYQDRYSEEFMVFTPDNYSDANEGNRELLINSFDNTILYIDDFLATAINKLKQTGAASAMIYSADHGEDIYDDSRKRFLHASPTPTFHQLYVPMIAWVSNGYNARFGMKAYENMRENQSQTLSPTETVFPTILSLAGISTPYINRSKSLADGEYKSTPLLYITDLNEPVSVEDSGVDKHDIKLFQEKQIKIK